MKYRGRRYRRATISLRTAASALVEVHGGLWRPDLHSHLVYVVLREGVCSNGSNNGTVGGGSTRSNDYDNGNDHDSGGSGGSSSSSGQYHIGGPRLSFASFVRLAAATADVAASALSPALLVDTTTLYPGSKERAEIKRRREATMGGTMDSTMDHTLDHTTIRTGTVSAGAEGADSGGWGVGGTVEALGSDGRIGGSGRHSTSEWGGGEWDERVAMALERTGVEDEGRQGGVGRSGGDGLEGKEEKNSETGEKAEERMEEEEEEEEDDRDDIDTKEDDNGSDNTERKERQERREKKERQERQERRERQFRESRTADPSRTTRLNILRKWDLYGGGGGGNGEEGGGHEDGKADNDCSGGGGGGGDSIGGVLVSGVGESEESVVDVLVSLQDMPRVIDDICNALPAHLHCGDRGAGGGKRRTNRRARSQQSEGKSNGGGVKVEDDDRREALKRRVLDRLHSACDGAVVSWKLFDDIWREAVQEQETNGDRLR